MAKPGAELTIEAAVQAGALTAEEVAVLRAEIGRIEALHPGALSPELVLEYADTEGSPLARYFEWSDSSAARKFRLCQAELLIRTVQVKVMPHRTPKRVATVSVTRDIERKIPRTVHTKVSSELDEALSELDNWVEKYSGVVQLDSFISAIRRFRRG